MKLYRLFGALAVFALLSACVRAPQQALNSGMIVEEAICGEAALYGPAARGKPTASGEAFDPDAFTAAHRSLPFGTILRVSYAGKTVDVRINDRSRADDLQILSVTRGTAARLDFLQEGAAKVCYIIVRRGASRVADAQSDKPRRGSMRACDKRCRPAQSR